MISLGQRIHNFQLFIEGYNLLGLLRTFDNCIGAIDGTHVYVTVPTEKVVQYTGRKGISTQNVLAICDFDMRFTFVLAGWLGSVHDMRVFNDALEKFGDKFSHLPKGMHGLFNVFFVLVVVFVMLLTQFYNYS